MKGEELGTDPEVLVLTCGQEMMRCHSLGTPLQRLSNIPGCS